MTHFTPQDVETLVGITPNILRDWRRRSLLSGIGALVLPDGTTTLDENHPDLKQQDRRTWLYRLGDLTRLAIAVELLDLGLDLKRAIALAGDLNAKVCAWATPESNLHQLARHERESRFVFAWPILEGSDENKAGRPVGSLAIFALNDLAQATLHVGAKAIFVDCAELAHGFSEGLRREMANRHIPPPAPAPRKRSIASISKRKG